MQLIGLTGDRVELPVRTRAKQIKSEHSSIWAKPRPGASVSALEVDRLLDGRNFCLPDDTAFEHDRYAPGIVEPEGRMEFAILAGPAQFQRLRQ